MTMMQLVIIVGSSSDAVTLDTKGQVKGVTKDGKYIRSSHEGGSKYERPDYIESVRGQAKGKRREYDALDEEDFTGY